MFPSKYIKRERLFGFPLLTFDLFFSLLLLLYKAHTFFLAIKYTLAPGTYRTSTMENLYFTNGQDGFPHYYDSSFPPSLPLDTSPYLDASSGIDFASTAFTAQPLAAISPEMIDIACPPALAPIFAPLFDGSAYYISSSQISKFLSKDVPYDCPDVLMDPFVPFDGNPSRLVIPSKVLQEELRAEDDNPATPSTAPSSPSSSCDTTHTFDYASRSSSPSLGSIYEPVHQQQQQQHYQIDCAQQPQSQEARSSSPSLGSIYEPVHQQQQHYQIDCAQQPQSQEARSSSPSLGSIYEPVHQQQQQQQYQNDCAQQPQSQEAPSPCAQMEELQANASSPSSFSSFVCNYMATTTTTTTTTTTSTTKEKTSTTEEATSSTATDTNSTTAATATEQTTTSRKRRRCATAVNYQEDQDHDDEHCVPSTTTTTTKQRESKRRRTAAAPTCTVPKKVQKNNAVDEADAYNNRPHVCPICHVRFSRSYNLRTHQLTHDKNRLKPFSCNVCEKGFARKHDRDRHVSAVHTGEKSFECTVCGAAFARKTYLMSHMTTNHP